MQCFKPVQIFFKSYDSMVKFPAGLEVPCGKCLACRVAKSREWAMRVTHELSYWSSAIFVTLTYDNDHCPKNYSLCKSDFQKFLKRLRKELSYVNRKIKYYACGEYGTKFGRPHYHAILYGLDSDFVDRDIVSRAWTLGLLHFGTVTYDSARYVAQYIDKKYTGPLADKYYYSKGRESPFQVCSQGLGLRYCFDHKDQMILDLYTTVRGVKCGLPRYYKSKLSIDNDRLMSIGALRRDELLQRIIDKGHNSVQTYHAQIARARQQNVMTLEAKAHMRSLRSATF